ncbi:hypothetical protein NP233_g10417 [Leucocoprinus birnbaumii]|uniref:Aminoglycoside phosphotransferase domain-containing protein n=1 Tax=Leucocoprinus birnbaumii TaxID=56174 RepID=A0AAD5VII1_9AGAR|nr:hypothetical protein NP233_g10417 [Leucocoprinus birnbaumii]
MAPISDTWPDVQLSLELLPPEFVNRVTSLVEWLAPHFSNIEAYASNLHPRHRRCRIVKDNYTWGQSFVVFELVFEDGGEHFDDGSKNGENLGQEEESWIIRFAMRSMDAYFNTAAQLERKIMNEAAALRLVRSRTTIPVPQIIAFHPVAGDSDPSEHQHSHGPHPLGPNFPAFVLMSAIRGITIEDCGIAIHELGQADPDSDPVQGDEEKRPILKQYLRDIADIHVQLSRITFDKIGGFVMDQEGNVTVGPGADFGLGPFDTAKEYFAIQAEAYERLAEAASEEDDDGVDGEDGEHSAECLKRRFVASLWRTAMMPLVDERDAGGPFPMRHGDLHSENVLVDETGHIVGVLDWDCAATVPWEAFAVPTFEVSGHFEESKNEPKTPVLPTTTSFSTSTAAAREVKHQLGTDLDGNESQPVTKFVSDSSSTKPQHPRRGHRRNRSRPQVHEEFNKALAEIEIQSSATATPSAVQSPELSPTPLPLDSEVSEEPLEPPPVTASGRSLAALHDSDAGYVGAYLAYWMYSLACDYEETGRALHRMLVARGLKDESRPSKEAGGDDGKLADWVLEGDMEEAFRKFVGQMRGEAGVTT